MATDIDVVAQKMLDNAPDPEAHVQTEADEIIEPEIKPKKAPVNAKDRYGRPFDPGLHVTDESGEPVLTRNGNLRLRPKGVREKKSEEKKSEEKTDTETAKAAEVISQRHQALARTTVNVMDGFTQAALAPEMAEEWKLSDVSKELLIEETANVYSFYHVDDLPPVAGLVVTVLGVWVLPALSKPHTRRALDNAFKSKKPMIEEPKGNEQPRFDSRQVRQWEDRALSGQAGAVL